MKGINKLIRVICRALVLGVIVCCSPVLAADDLNRQLEKMIEQLSTSSLKGEVIKGSDTEVYLTLGQVDGVVEGNRFEIVRPGAPLKVGSEIFGNEEVPVAKVEVIKVREKMSICRVVEKTGVPQSGDLAYPLRKQVKRIVVGQFSYNQSFNQLTKNLQEKMVTSLTNRGMQVVERDQLERVLKEQKLGYSGLVNMESAKKIGELLGAEGMLLGTINDMGNEINLNGRLVDIGTGDAISASEVALPKTPLIAQLLETQIDSEPSTVSPEDASAQSPKNANKSQQQAVFENDWFRIEVVSLRRNGSDIELKLRYINRTNEAVSFALDDPEKNTYLVDELGNQYFFKSAELKINPPDFPAGIPRISSINFRDIKGDGKHIIAAVSYTNGHGGNFFASFKELVIE